jgi:hypothetical protein
MRPVLRGVFGGAFDGVRGVQGGSAVNCPYCKREIFGWTGLQELQKFNKHLRKCRKNPNNIALTDGIKTVVTPIKEQNINDALIIRHESGQ